MAALQLTCAYELFQVWNMATTETQLMLSVGLIGKFRLGSRSFVFFFKRSRRLRSAEHAGQSHDTIVIRECLVYCSCMFNLNGSGWVPERLQ